MEVYFGFFVICRFELFFDLSDYWFTGNGL